MYEMIEDGDTHSNICQSEKSQLQLAKIDEEARILAEADVITQNIQIYKKEYEQSLEGLSQRE